MLLLSLKVGFSSCKILRDFVFGFMQDIKIQRLLGHFQKEFEGELSAEKLGEYKDMGTSFALLFVLRVGNFVEFMQKHRHGKANEFILHFEKEIVAVFTQFFLAFSDSLSAFCHSSFLQIFLKLMHFLPKFSLS